MWLKKFLRALEMWLGDVLNVTIIDFGEVTGEVTSLFPHDGLILSDDDGDLMEIKRNGKNLTIRVLRDDS